MTDIGVGDFVECIEVRSKTGEELYAGYVLGEIYIVSEVGLWNNHPWLNCEGCLTATACGKPYPGWTIRAFCKLYSPKSSLIESLKTQIPKETVADALNTNP